MTCGWPTPNDASLVFCGDGRPFLELEEEYPLCQSSWKWTQDVSKMILFEFMDMNLFEELKQQLLEFLTTSRIGPFRVFLGSSSWGFGATHGKQQMLQPPLQPPTALWDAEDH